MINIIRTIVTLHCCYGVIDTFHARIYIIILGIHGRKTAYISALYDTNVAGFVVHIYVISGALICLSTLSQLHL
jgi:hypothetical protein